MSSDESFVPKGEQAEVPYTDDAAAQREDERTAESEATGKVPASEVEGLKDQLGGGEVLEGEGYTRSSNKEGGYAAAEEELDSKVEQAE